MARSDGLVHHKLPPDSVVHTRQPVPVETEDTEKYAKDFESLGLTALHEQLATIARKAENRGNLVDEYNSAAITGAASSASVVVQPTYEYMPEKIESVIITGPTGTPSFTLQLGDRTWALTLPATGILVIGYVGVLLGRTDQRILTPATPGIWTLELMGVADRRFSI